LKQIQILKAQPPDHTVLTNIAFAAKKYWNYPENYYDIWRNELTITADYINQNIVYKALHHNTIIGFYSIIENKSDFYTGEIFVQKGFWLEHIFILPEFHHLGIGRLMMHHTRKISQDHGIKNLMIFVDPFAKGFYDKIGAKFMFESKSSIPGRFIPVYDLKI
jgi:maltose O-acetyltransferase